MPLHRALSVRQPWANLIASGDKGIELRTWTTDYRGPLVICAAKAIADVVVTPPLPMEPRGCVLCRVQLIDVRPLKRQDCAKACLPRSRFDAALFAFVLDDPEQLQPIPVSGSLGLFGIPDRFVVPA